MGAVTWAPSGRAVAYGLGGVNLYDLDTGTSTLLLASSPYPDLDSGTRPEGIIRFFSPAAFSPDGQRLLVDFGYFMEGGGLALLTLSSNSLTELNSDTGIPCCEATWTPDSSGLYFANPLAGMIAAGLWRADAATGSSTTLIEGGLEADFQMPSHPQLLSDGKLYYFYATSATYPDTNPGLTMTRSEPDGVTGRTPLRGDSIVVYQAVWDPNARGAVVAVMPVVQTGWPFTGPLMWLPADGGPSVALPTNGRDLDWGAN